MLFLERVISLGPREATLQLLPDGLKKVLIKLLIVHPYPSCLRFIQYTPAHCPGTIESPILEMRYPENRTIAALCQKSTVCL